MAAHLVLDAARLDAVQGSVGELLGHQKQGNAPGARGAGGGGGRVRQASQNAVNDVVGQVVVPAADEDLGAGDRVGTVLVAIRFCDDLSSSPKTTQCHTHTQQSPTTTQL